MKNRTVKWLVFALAFAVGIYIGGGIYETIVIQPVWTASAEVARNWNENPLFVIQNAWFFIPATNLATLLALLTLIFGWKSPPPVRFWLRLGTIILLVMYVFTLAYFIPEQLALRGHEATKNLSDAEILTRAGRWGTLNYIRVIVALPAVFAILKALSLSAILEDKNK
ncbi:MAG TPA: DUF1772 domain-containing protein [Pyrinomonadaceae bacterium]|nr:DUF1772 domain-containing protein [Pyrinomonadaceae bacterium]